MRQQKFKRRTFANIGIVFFRAISRKVAILYRPMAGRSVLRPDVRSKSIITQILIALIILLGYIIPILVLPEKDGDKLLGTFVNGILWGGIYALVALGVVVIYKATKVFNLGQGGIILFLTYFFWWLHAPSEMNLNLPIALVLLVLGASVLGLTINRVLMRPMIGQSGMVTFLVTLFLGFNFFQGTTIMIFEGKSQNMPEIFPSGTFVAGNLHFPYPLLFGFISATAMFLLFTAYFRFSKGGLAMRCVSENNVISQSMGINVKRVYSLAWVVGCLSAALGGIILGSLISVYSEMGGIGGYAVMRALPILLLGGLESLQGAFFGAMLVALAEQTTATYVDPHITGFRAVFPYILMVTILMIRPHGLYGLKDIERI